MNRFTLASAVLAVAASATLATATARDLTYGSYTSSQHLIHRTGLDPFVKRVEEESGGDLTSEVFSGGAMGGPKELLKAVRDNVVDSAGIVDVYVKSDLPVTSMFSSLLILPDDMRVYAAAMNEMQLLNCPSCQAEHERSNMIGLMWYPTATYHLLCTSPVSSLEDLAGKKIRAASRMGVMLQDMGATAVSITTAEMYEALQRGQIDCAAGSAAWLDSYNLKDYVTAVMETPIGGFFGTIGFNMNRDTWDDLTDEQKAIIVRNLPEFVADVTYNYVVENDDAIEALAAGGGTLTQADDAFMAKLAAAREAEYKTVETLSQEAGIDDAGPLLATFRELVTKWQGIVAEVGEDQDAYEEALWNEIFSKI